MRPNLRPQRRQRPEARLLVGAHLVHGPRIGHDIALSPSDVGKGCNGKEARLKPSFTLALPALPQEVR